MSVQPDRDPSVPTWDTADRLRKSLRQASVEVQEIAVYLGVSRSTVSNYINGRIEPSTRTMRLWALRCGVSYDWLCHGTEKPCFDGNQSGVSAGQRGVMNPCSSPPNIRAFRPEVPHRNTVYTLPIALPVAA